jgi:bifunctional DNA-binding transcriptional regulator/antitoxin component of YhaV-PrlF toxin-antitoxin module
MSELIQLSLDQLGRILVPAALQQRLGLSPGMTLIVERGDNDEVRLRPRAETPVLIEKDGVLVVRAEPLSDLDGFVRREHEQRLSVLLERMAP